MKTAVESKLSALLQDPKRFTLLPDGWIKDEFTGIDLGPSSDEEMNMKDAIKFCEEKGGRLPTIHELHSLVDFTKEQPACYSIFKDTKSSWYWSSTNTAWNKKAVWCVSFYYGYVYFCYEGRNGYVRPVRPSQA